MTSSDRISGGFMGGVTVSAGFRRRSGVWWAIGASRTNCCVVSVGRGRSMLHRIGCDKQSDPRKSSAKKKSRGNGCER